MGNPSLDDRRPRCPHCKHVMRLGNCNDMEISMQVEYCPICGMKLPFPELIQCAYQEDEFRLIALRFLQGRVTVSDAKMLAEAWLKFAE